MNFLLKFCNWVAKHRGKILLGLIISMLLLLLFSTINRAIMCEDDKSVKVSCSGVGCDGIDPVTGEYFKFGETCREFRTLFTGESNSLHGMNITYEQTQILMGIKK